jgi:hypothetical protein
MRSFTYIAGWLGTLVLLVLSACQTEKKQDPLLDEAGRYHLEAIEVQEVLEPKIEQIDSLRAVLLAQKTPAATANAATLDSLKKAFEDWEANLVEVPGLKHEHHDHKEGAHNHHHHHKANPLRDLPAEQMRDLQRETLANIKQMQARLAQVTN